MNYFFCRSEKRIGWICKNLLNHWFAKVARFDFRYILAFHQEPLCGNAHKVAIFFLHLVPNAPQSKIEKRTLFWNGQQQVFSTLLPSCSRRVRKTGQRQGQCHSLQFSQRSWTATSMDRSYTSGEFYADYKFQGLWDSFQPRRFHTSQESR